MIKKIKILSLVCLLPLLIAGCNIFEWTYSAEKSTDLTAVLAEADAQLRQGEYEKALALYDRALSIETNSASALYGRVRCRLQIIANGNSIYSSFPYLFAPAPAGSNPFFSYEARILSDNESNFTDSTQDIFRLTSQYTTTDQTISTNRSEFSANCALSYALHGTLSIDAHSDLQLLQDFTILWPTNATSSSASNTLIALYAATNSIRHATTFSALFMQQDPAYSHSNTAWQYLKANMMTLLSNTESTITNLEAKL